jgi:hypothetical protein
MRSKRFLKTKRRRKKSSRNSSSNNNLPCHNQLKFRKKRHKLKVRALFGTPTHTSGKKSLSTIGPPTP